MQEGALRVESYSSLTGGKDFNICLMDTDESNQETVGFRRMPYIRAEFFEKAIKIL
jgi:hypothetical protein